MQPDQFLGRKTKGPGTGYKFIAHFLADIGLPGQQPQVIRVVTGDKGILVVRVEFEYHVAAIEWPEKRHLEMRRSVVPDKFGMPLGYLAFPRSRICAAVNNPDVAVVTEGVFCCYINEITLKTVIKPGYFMPTAKIAGLIEPCDRLDAIRHTGTGGQDDQKLKGWKGAET